MRARPSRFTALGVLIGVVATLGCVTPVTEDEIEQQLEQAAAAMRLGPRRVMPITAETKLVARALLYEARHDPESRLSLQLSRRLAAAARRRQSVVVGGPYAALSDRVLTNALSLNADSGLRGLKVVLVSSESPSRELARAARGVRAQLYHRSLP
jgi:hypothetical protein